MDAAMETLRAAASAALSRAQLLEPALGALLPEDDRRRRLERAVVEVEARLAHLAHQGHPGGDSWQDEIRQALPLVGRIVGVKDVFHVAHLRTLVGCPQGLGLGETCEQEDAEVVARLRSAGALVLGKLAVTEFVYFEPSRTLNPSAQGHTPGGSSSGSAAAVAAGLCDIALGTQICASVSRPASFCGVVGFKPSQGRVPGTGVFTPSPSLDQIGWMTRGVPEAALVAPLLCEGWRQGQGLWSGDAQEGGLGGDPEEGSLRKHPEGSLGEDAEEGGLGDNPEEGRLRENTEQNSEENPKTGGAMGKRECPGAVDGSTDAVRECPGAVDGSTDVVRESTGAVDGSTDAVRESTGAVGGRPEEGVMGKRGRPRRLVRLGVPIPRELLEGQPLGPVTATPSERVAATPSKRMPATPSGAALGAPQKLPSSGIPTKPPSCGSPDASKETAEQAAAPEARGLPRAAGNAQHTPQPQEEKDPLPRAEWGEGEKGAVEQMRLHCPLLAKCSSPVLLAFLDGVRRLARQTDKIGDAAVEVHNIPSPFTESLDGMFSLHIDLMASEYHSLFQQPHMARAREAASPKLKALLEAGAAVGSARAREAKASMGRLRKCLDSFLQERGLDALVYPGAATTAPALSDGMTFVGWHGSDEGLLHTATVVEDLVKPR